MDQNALRNEQLTGQPSLTSLTGRLDFKSTAIVALSFTAGVIVALGVFSSTFGSEASETAAVESSVSQDDAARQVLDAPVEAEVAGVVCEDLMAPVNLTSSVEDVFAAWNDTVESAGDECTPAFDEDLGPTWVMNEAPISIFGNAGSIYEVAFTADALLSELTIVLVEEDAVNGERDHLISAIDTVWGSDTIDWEFACPDSESDWAGVLGPDDLTVEISRC